MATSERTMEYPGLPYIPTEEEQDNEIAEAGESARVSFLDPDFLCFALPCALILDLIGLILAILIIATVGVSWIILLAVDLFGMAVIGSWVYWRTNGIAQSKEEKKKELQESIDNAQKQMQSIEKESTKDVGKVVGKDAEKMAAKDAEKLMIREATEDALKATSRSAGKLAGKEFLKAGGLIGKIFLRTGIKTGSDATVIGAVINLIPFWTITVLETLREK